MTIASGSTTRLAVIQESTWGTTPSNPTWLIARMTGESLNLTKQFITSNEIQSDRNVRDAIGVGEGAGGDIQIEWAYGGSGTALDAMLEGVMFSAFAAADTGSTTLSVGSTTTFTRASGSFIDDGFQAGDEITSSGFPTVGNNGTFTISTVAATTITITAASLSVESGDGGERLLASASNVLKNGTTQKPLSIEKTFDTGATDVFCRMTGLIGNTLSLTASARQILTGSIGFLGKGGLYDNAIASGATYTAAPTGSVMDAAANFASLSVTGLTSPKIRTITLNATNNLREQAVVGSDELAGIGAGRFEVSGTMEVYLEDKTLLDLYFNSTAADLSFIIGSTTTEKYRFLLPSLKFTSAEVVAGGNDQDVVVNAGWTGLYDSGAACTLMINREVA